LPALMQCSFHLVLFASLQLWNVFTRAARTAWSEECCCWVYEWPLHADEAWLARSALVVRPLCDSSCVALERAVFPLRRCDGGGPAACDEWRCLPFARFSVGGGEGLGVHARLVARDSRGGERVGEGWRRPCECAAEWPRVSLALGLSFRAVPM
jgi:hypothetical protein